LEGEVVHKRTHELRVHTALVVRAGESCGAAVEYLKAAAAVKHVMRYELFASSLNPLLPPTIGAFRLPQNELVPWTPPSTEPPHVGLAAARTDCATLLIQTLLNPGTR
jgi:hypothetical protein